MDTIKIWNISLFMILFSFVNAQSDWELKKDKDGIKVYVRTKEGQKLKASKAEMIVDASPLRIVEVISDVPNYTDWTPKTESAKILKTIDENNFYYKNIIKAPMVSYKDLIVKVNVATKGNTTTITMKGEPSFIKENENYVRMPSYSGVYKLTKLSNGKTNMELEYSADPGGELPSWLVNTAAVDVPYDIFSNLRDIF